MVTIPVFTIARIARDPQGGYWGVFANEALVVELGPSDLAKRDAEALAFNLNRTITAFTDSRDYGIRFGAEHLNHLGDD